MNKDYVQIIENQQKFIKLASDQFVNKEGITKENVKAVLNERGRVIREVIGDTNILIESTITPYLKDITLLDEAKASELEELAEKLSGYKDNIDTGLAFEIRHALVEYAKMTKNDSLYIKNLFYMGIALFYLDASLFKKEMSQCYETIMQYSVDYEKFDKETRNIIVRAYGNYYVSCTTKEIDMRFERIDLAIRFWNDVAKKVDPDFPWKAYFGNVHENLCSAVISTFRMDEKIELKEEYIRRCYASAEHLNQENADGIIHNNHDYTSADIKNLYFLYAAKYYNNMITGKELIDFLYKMYKQANNEYTYDNLFKKFHISGLVLYYFGEVSEEEFSLAERKRIASEIEQDIYSYAMSIPDSISRAYVAKVLANFATAAHELLEDFSYLKMLLSLTVFRHIPTYVHSVIVGRIAFVIIEYLAKYHPEEFVGMPEVNSVEDLDENIGEILLFTWYSSLIHDIGKIVYSHVVSFYVRKLNDKEFEMIKYHPEKAKDFIKKNPNFSTESEIYETLKQVIDFGYNDNVDLFSHFSDVALGHHKSYDGKFGYPRDFDNTKSVVKLIIDVVSIADSIDAATDSVGRSYASEKTLEDMREDLLSQIETRYSPKAVKLIFENEGLYKAINQIITKDRFDVYYSCFASDDFSATMMPPSKALN